MYPRNSKYTIPSAIPKDIAELLTYVSLKKQHFWSTLEEGEVLPSPHALFSLITERNITGGFCCVSWL